MAPLQSVNGHSRRALGVACSLVCCQITSVIEPTAICTTQQPLDTMSFYSGTRGSQRRQTGRPPLQGNRIEVSVMPTRVSQPVVRAD